MCTVNRCISLLVAGINCCVANKPQCNGREKRNKCFMAS